MWNLIELERIIRQEARKDGDLVVANMDPELMQFFLLEVLQDMIIIQNEEKEKQHETIQSARSV